MFLTGAIVAFYLTQWTIEWIWGYFATAPSELVPSLGEADAIIRDVEGRYPDLAVLDREIARWWAIA